jgi:hypothetical protein
MFLFVLAIVALALVAVVAALPSILTWLLTVDRKQVAGCLVSISFGAPIVVEFFRDRLVTVRIRSPKILVQPYREVHAVQGVACVCVCVCITYSV